MQGLDRQQITHQLLIAWCAAVFLLGGVHALALDTRVADFLYETQGSAWLLRNHPFVQNVMHVGGRRFSLTLGVVVLMALVASFRVTALRAWRRPLGYLLVASVTSTLVVAAIKSNVSMDCPWGLQRYGGDQPFVGLMQRRPSGMPDAACFPSGHAAAGYAWLSLYHFLGVVAPRCKWAGLLFALTLGVAFGVTQQVRGAHFLSHDIWAIVICWTVASVLAAAWFPRA